MSPTTRTRKPTVRAHERSEIVTAVLVGAGIVLVVLLLIWLLRPADPTKTGSGGLFTRQPRATLLVILGAGALAWALWWIRRGHRRPKRRGDHRHRARRHLLARRFGAPLAQAGKARARDPELHGCPDDDAGQYNEGEHRHGEHEPHDRRRHDDSDHRRQVGRLDRN
jgi:hypothetical protein